MDGPRLKASSISSGNAIPEGQYSTKDFERVVSLLTRTEAAAKHLTDYLRRTDRWAKTIVFCVDQEHADQMRRALHNANADLTKAHPNYVVRIVSDEGDIGKGHLSDFADTEKDVPVIATTSEMLSTGVDLPTVRNIVLFRPVGSMAMFKQMIGRGTRLYPDEDKLSFDIIDYSGATALFSDPEFDGPPERVDEEEIDDEGDFVTETVRALYPDPKALRGAWSHRVGREEVRTALEAHGIDPEEILERTGMVTADPIDVLVHLAWNQPLATRTDRARRVTKEHAGFFATFQPEAREVLTYLLDKYTEFGIGQLDDLDVLQVPPISTLGTPAEIASRFGSPATLREAIAALGDLLYVA